MFDFTIEHVKRQNSHYVRDEKKAPLWVKALDKLVRPVFRKLYEKKILSGYLMFTADEEAYSMVAAADVGGERRISYFGHSGDNKFKIGGH